MANKLSLTDLKGTLKPLSEPDQRAMGKQLTEQYERTQLAALEIVAFGAMFNQIEENVSACGHDKGGRGKKGGMAEWLRTFAPEIGRSNAYRYRDIAEAMRVELCLKSHEQLHLVAAREQPSKLEPKLAKKRERLVKIVADKSVRGLQAELGLYDESAARKHTPAKKLSPEERREQWKEAARANAIHAFDSLLRVEERWKLLTDDQITLAQKTAAKLAKEMDRWLATPAPGRAALQLDKYLGEETA